MSDEKELDTALESLSEALEGNAVEEVEEEVVAEEIPAEPEKTEPETPAETPVVEDSDKPVEAPQVDDSLIERAIKAGIPIGVAKTADADSLKAHVESLEAAAKPAEETPEEKPYEPDLDTDTYDEKVIAEFKKVGKLVTDQQEVIKSLKGEVESLKSTIEQSARAESGQRAVKMFDEDIAKLGDEFKEAVGEGSYGSELKQSNPKAFQTRMNILDNLIKLKQAMPGSDHSKMFNMAVYNVTGKLPGAKAEAPVDDTPAKLAEHAKKVVGVPKSGKSQTKKGELNAAIDQLSEALGG